MKATDDTLLRRASLFQFLSDEHFEKLRALLHEEHYEFGDIIVRQGESADSFFILLSGRARVVKADQNGTEVVLASVKPGDSFGEAALAEGGTRSATVRCSTGVEALRLDRADFLQVVEDNPELKQHLEITARHRALHGFLYQFSNFGRLPVPALRSLIEKLTPVEVAKGRAIIQQGDKPGAMFILEKGRARAFAQNNGSQKNLAFYRDGDFFGELSILKGTPRSASVEAFSDCRLLALEPAAVRDLKQNYPEFGQLMEERLAQYEAKTEARVPLDFTTEMLPAASATHDKVALDENAAKRSDDAEAPFAEEGGLFRKSKKRIRKIEALEQIDEMDCGAASLGMICRHFGRKVSLARIRQLCHTSTDGTSLKAICRAATELGLAARALKVSLRNLNVMPLPAIIHWEGNHWMVLYDVQRQIRAGGRSGARSAQDSAQGIRAELVRLRGACSITRPRSRMRPESKATFAWMMSVPREIQSHLRAGHAPRGRDHGARAALPDLHRDGGRQGDRRERHRPAQRSSSSGWARRFSSCTAASLAQEFLLSFAAVRLDTAILDFLSRQMLSLPMTYFTSRRTGDIQRRLDGARQVRQFAVQHGIGAILALVQLVGALSLMVIYSPSLMFAFLATTPLYLGLMYFSQKVLRPLFAGVEESQGKYARTRSTRSRGSKRSKPPPRNRSSAT